MLVYTELVSKHQTTALEMLLFYFCCSLLKKKLLKQTKLISFTNEARVLEQPMTFTIFSLKKVILQKNMQ